VLERFKNHINNEPIYSTASIYLAISGGVDSMVLSHLLSTLKIEHTLLHCNFNLRGIDSNKDEACVTKYALENSLKIKVKSFDTKKESEKLNLNTQECARQLRYDWFKTFLMQPNSILLTAHHLDDSIETFFINILRGTGLKGMSGISSGAQQIYRPLLAFTKKDIINYASKYSVNFREDASNQSDNYLRNKLRHHTIPQLKEYTTGFNKKMNTLINELQAVDDYLDYSLKQQIQALKQTKTIKIEDLKQIPTVMWPKLFKSFGLTRKQNTAFINFINSSTGSLFHTNTYTFLLDRAFILLTDTESKPILNQLIHKTTIEIEFDHASFSISTIPNTNIIFNHKTAFIDYSKLDFPLTLRTWQKGDKIQPLGMTGKKLISDILIDKKINLFDKQNQLVVVSNNTIVWLVDHVISDAFAIQKSTEKILKIEHIKYY